MPDYHSQHILAVSSQRSTGSRLATLATYNCYPIWVSSDRSPRMEKQIKLRTLTSIGSGFRECNLLKMRLAILLSYSGDYYITAGP